MKLFKQFKIQTYYTIENGKSDRGIYWKSVQLFV